LVRSGTISTVPRRPLPLFVLVALAYAAGSQTAWSWFGAGVHPVFFPAAGVTVAALVLTPRARWVYVLAGAGLAELTVDLAHGQDPLLACGWVVVNLAEATLGASLLLYARRWAAIDLSRHADLLAFLALPVAVSPAVGGLLASANAELLGDGVELPEFALRWWIGDGLGVLVVAGAVIAVSRSGVARIRARWGEALVLTLVATAATALVFALDAVYWAYLPFVVMPWIALRLGTAAVAVVGGLIAIIAAQEVSLAPSLWDAVDVAPRSGIVYVQVAIALLTATSLLLAAEAGERENAVRERARADEEYRYEHDVAVSLQRALLPERLVDHPNLGLAATYRPSDERLEVGGDWYETLSLPGGRIGVAVGDVVGHGLTAAAAMGQLRTAVAALAPDSATPVDLLDQLDEFAHSSMIYSTACFAAVDPATGIVEHASAGHPPILLVERSGAGRFLLDGRSWPISAGIGPRGVHGAAVLGEGATLVLYSDGLVERRGESIDRGLERLAASAERFAALPLPAFCEALVDDLLGEREVRDDVVVVGVRLLVRTPLAGERGDQVASGST
jgi:serine phosphatase RsbU (regulator of sigma subunit)/integral membrane sensor domain MASE1